MDTYAPTYNVVKGSRVKARWFSIPTTWDRTALSGMQMKLPAVEHFAEGVVTHIRGDHPVSPTKIQVAILQADGVEVWVDPSALYASEGP